MSEEIPLRPMGKSDIHKLETALLLATLFRPDVIEEIRKAEERLTWVDSLAVAAAALAREKAGMPVSRIADELGRSEATIRNHLTGKTKAGKLVRETYEKFLREGVKIELPETLVKEVPVKVEEIEKKYKKEIEELKKRLEESKKKIEELTNAKKELEEKLAKIESEKKVLEEKINKIKEIIG